MKQELGVPASSGGRAATPSGPSPSVSGIAGIPNAELIEAFEDAVRQAEHDCHFATPPRWRVSCAERDAAREELLAAWSVMQRALATSQETFAHYARLHFAKGTKEGCLKAAANADMANLCGLALHGSGALAAQGIDAATAGETRSEADGLDPKDESPVGEADAPNTPPGTPHNTGDL